MDTAQLHEVWYSFAFLQSWPNGLWKLLPGVCWHLVALIQTEFLPVSRQKKFSKTVTRHNSECSSSAAHLAKERRSTAAPLAPFVSRPKHLENIRGMKSDNRTSLAILYQRQPQKHHSKKSHEMQKIKAITTPCCLKFLNFAKV